MKPNLNMVRVAVIAALCRPLLVSAQPVAGVPLQRTEIQELILRVDSLIDERQFDTAICLGEELLERAQEAAGGSDATTARALHMLGRCYFDQGDYVRCEPAWRKSVSILDSLSGPNDPDLASSLHSLGRVCCALGEYAEAELLYVRALDIRKKALEPDFPDVAATLNSLGIVYRSQGSYAKAESLYNQALDIGKKALGPNHPDVAQSLNNLAVLLWDQSKYADAEHLHRKALEIRINALGSDHPDVAQSLNNLGLLSWSQDRYADAERLFLQALEIRENVLGPNHPDVATTLNNLGLVYRDQGEYARAEPLLQRALSIKRRSLGTDHPGTAMTLYNLGSLCRRQGNYTEAEPFYTEALEIRKKTLGADHPEVAQSLHALGLLFQNQAKYAEAERFYRQALDIRTRTLAPDSPELAQSLNNLGLVCQYQGKQAEAEPLYKHALGIRRKSLGPEHPYVATSLSHLADLYRRQGRYAEAEPLYEEVVDIRRKTLGSGHPRVAADLSSLAGICRNQGKYAEAESLHKQALAIRRQQLGSDHLDVARSLNDLGLLYWDQGRYAEAEPLYKEALDIKSKVLGIVDPGTALTLNNLANLYRYQGKYAEAESLCEQALDIREKTLGADHPDLAASLYFLANIYAERGRYREAEHLQNRAIDIWGKALGPDHVFVALSLNDLGNILQKQQRYSEAEPLHRRALVIQENALGSHHPDVATTMNDLARVYVSQSRYAEAEDMFKRALVAKEEALGPDHPYVAVTLESMSELCRHQAEHQNATELAKRACHIRQSNFATNGIVLSERDALRYAQCVRRSVDNYLTCYSELANPDSATINDAVEVIFSGKGQVSDEMFWRQRALAEETDSATVALAESLRITKFRLSQLFVQGPAENLEDYRQTVTSLGKLANEREADLSRRSAGFRNRLSSANLDAAHIGSLLPGKSVLIEYLKYNYHQLDSDSTIPRYLAVAVSNDGEPAVIRIGDASEIESLVDRYRRHMTRVSSFRRLLDEDQRDYEEVSTGLYRRIWQPIEHLAAGKDLILIAPDGALNLISFAGLVDADGVYLVERSTIHYLSCGRDLIRYEHDVGSGSGLFVMGDPDYDAPVAVRLSELSAPHDTSADPAYYVNRNVPTDCREPKRTVLSPLPATRSEVERVVTSWRQATDEPLCVCLRSSASEEKFKAEAPGNRVIHLATHGYFLGNCSKPDLSNIRADSDVSYVGENPLLLSGLFFAGANLSGEAQEGSGAEDGVLTAYEVSALSLAGTDLVVLSACETGLGKVEEGEGVYGLRRAFQMAGARTVISALWPVSDRITAEIIGSMYQRERVAFPEQLRAVQLERIRALRDQEKPDHPVTWGAFIAVGDWR